MLICRNTKNGLFSANRKRSEIKHIGGTCGGLCHRKAPTCLGKEKGFMGFAQVSVWLIGIATPELSSTFDIQLTVSPSTTPIKMDYMEHFAMTLDMPTTILPVTGNIYVPS